MFRSTTGNLKFQGFDVPLSGLDAAQRLYGAELGDGVDELGRYGLVERETEGWVGLK
ncbi:MAG TPA: hypothetical protein VJN18_15955 [Polyangiaceae bacterium]|nr:hypothetical protein [Polyangiaceae bacterium]